MAHVQSATGVREHGQTVIFFTWPVLIANKAGAVIPGFLGFFSTICGSYTGFMGWIFLLLKWATGDKATGYHLRG